MKDERFGVDFESTEQHLKAHRRVTSLPSGTCALVHPSAFRLHPFERGFTLIEILIVLVIIGITIALVSVNFRRDAKAELREEALRLSLLLQAARTEAITTGKSLAWVASPPNYGFYTRDEERHWTVALTDPPLSQGTLPAQITLADVRINRAQVPVDTPLIFSASGLNAPFRLELAASTDRLLVYGDVGGNIGTAEVSP